MQGGDAEVAGLGKGDGVLHGLAGAHLTDKDDIRRLTQGVAQRRLEALRVDADFPLGNDAAVVFVHVFNGVFDGDDVAMAVAVAVTDHRRQGAGLAGAGGADDDHQAALGHGQVCQHLRNTQFGKGRDIGLDAAQDDAGMVLLLEDVGAEAPGIRRGNGEIAFLRAIKLRSLGFAHDGIGELAHLVCIQRHIRDGRNAAVDLQAGRHTGGDKQV